MIEAFGENQELIFAIDKPLGWTSFDVIKKIRNRLSSIGGIPKLKVGHAGTLDPLASGVLVICVGKATKKIESLQGQEKEYIACLRLGATTPSFDAETEIDVEYEYKHITKELVEETLLLYIGEIEQCPPLYSAVKVNGTRAYRIARNGGELELQPKNIFIEAVEILKFELPLLTLKITCGKGTYIRSLARDLGKSLNSGAYLEGLIRTKVGNYTIENALSMEDFEKECESFGSFN